MLELRDFPLTYKEGVYSVADFSQDIEGDNAVSFDYDAQYQIDRKSTRLNSSHS